MENGEANKSLCRKKMCKINMYPATRQKEPKGAVCQGEWDVTFTDRKERFSKSV